MILAKGQLKSLLVPSVFQVVVCVGLTLGIFTYTYRGLVGEIILRSSGVDQAHFNQTVGQLLANLDTIKLAQNSVIWLFWATLGLMLYLVYIGISNAFIGMWNQVVIETSFANHPTWKDYFRRPLLQLVAAILLLGSLLLTAYLLLPLWVTFSDQFVASHLAWQAVGYLLVAVAGVLINIYFIWTLAEIVLALG